MKKRFSKYLITVMLVLILACSCAAFSACKDDDDGTASLLIYELNSDNTYAVTGVSDTTVAEIIVPEKYKEVAVTTIADEAFKGCSSLKKIVIPSSVTGMGKRALGGCGRLAELTIPFTGAGKNASASRSSLGYMFGQSYYSGATETTQYYSDNDDDYDIYYIPASLITVTFTGESVPYGAFYNCSEIKTFVIGDSVASIGANAFTNNNFTFVYVNSVSVASQLTGAKACGNLLSNVPAVGILNGISKIGGGVSGMDSSESYSYGGSGYTLFTNKKEYRFESESSDHFSGLSAVANDIGANGVVTSGGYYLTGWYPNGGSGEAYMKYRIWSHKQVTVTMIFCCGRRTATWGTFKKSWRTTVNGTQIVPEEDTAFENLPGETYQWTQWTRYEVCEFDLIAGDNAIYMHFLPDGNETASSYNNDMNVHYIAFDTPAVLAWSI